MRTVIPAFVIAALWASAVAHPAVAQNAPRPCGDPVPGRMMDADEQAMLDRLNTYRASRQLMTLVPAAPLVASVQAKVSDAGRLAAFMHDDPDRTWEQRIVDCGYPADAASGELFGCELDGIEALMRSWHESPIHFAVLNNGLFTAAGVARALHPGGYPCWVIALGSVVP